MFWLNLKQIPFLISFVVLKSRIYIQNIIIHLTQNSSMPKFWITENIKKDRKYYFKLSNIVFVVLIILSFAIFAFYSNITNIVFNKDKVDIFKEDLQQIAFYFWNFDEEVSKMLLNIDDITQSYIRWDNVLLNKETEILNTLNYIESNEDYLKDLWFQKYDKFLSLLWWLENNRTEVSDLLWKNGEHNYLVILQNTNEKRPNGWFFGSFAFITVADWKLINLEIVDAYYPDYIAHYTRLQAPDRTSSFLPDKKIGFIAWNKFGFSDIDGSNLKRLYEKMFNEDYVMRKVEKTMEPWLYEKLLHKNIKWVIFIRSDLIEYLIPSFTEKTRERQFQNANVDIIRGEYRWNKKEEYIKEVTEYFQKHQFDIFKKLINNFDDIIDKNYVNIYLSNVSDSLQNLLLSHNLKTIYNTWNIYARDTNTSFNKVSHFVKKNIQIINTNKKIVVDTDRDIIPIRHLSTWKYTMKIYYTLNVSNYYKKFIKNLEKEYNIEMTDRELGILAMKPAKFNEDEIAKRMETKATIYFPLNFKLLKIQWKQQEYKKFFAPFANGLLYTLLINKNHETKSIEITFEIK